MRRAVITLLLICLAGGVALLVVADHRQTRLAFTLGVTPGGPAPAIAPGQTGCQGPIDVPEGGAFDTVQLPLGTYMLAGPALQLTVRDAGSGAVISRGALAGGYADVDAGQQHIAVTPRVPQATRIVVCLRNTGTRKVAPYANGDVAAVNSTYTRDGKPQNVDIVLVFQRSARSLLSLDGLIADRSALFRPGWVGPWTYWLLAFVIALGIPALLALALSRAGRDSDG